MSIPFLRRDQDARVDVRHRVDRVDGFSYRARREDADLATLRAVNLVVVYPARPLDYGASHSQYKASQNNTDNTMAHFI